MVGDEGGLIMWAKMITENAIESCQCIVKNDHNFNLNCKLHLCIPTSSSFASVVLFCVFFWFFSDFFFFPKN